MLGATSDKDVRATPFWPWQVEASEHHHMSERMGFWYQCLNLGFRV